MKMVALRDVADINPKAEKVAPDEEVSFVGMADLDIASALTQSTTVRPFCEVSKGYTTFADGDILVAKITPCFENNKIGQAQLSCKIGVGSTEFHVVRPSERLHDRYLLNFLRQERVRRAGELRMTGSGGQRRVPVNFLEGMRVPLPPLDEQRRIATILDKANALRSKRKTVVDKLGALVPSVFVAMFGDPIANTRDLPRTPIGAVAEVITGNSPLRSNLANYGNSIEWIKSDNLGGDFASIAEEWLSDEGRMKARVAPIGSVLVTCIAGSPKSIGKASLVDREVAFNQQINAILPSDDIDTLFILGQLKTAPGLIRKKSTGGMKGLVNKSAFQSVEILWPSLDLQREFAAVVRQVASQLSAQREALVHFDELFASLQSRAFAGQL